MTRRPKVPGFVARHAAILAAMAIVGGILFASAAPTVTGEDSGELVTAAWFFGVPHPPGYPLWTLLCGAWMHLIAVGSVAWRANLFSALCTTLAVGCLTATLQQLKFRRSTSAAVAIAAGLSRVVWSQSVIAEVYSLNLLIQAAMMQSVAAWSVDRRPGRLLWAALLVGLGMTNHHILGFAALPTALWIAWLQPSIAWNWRLLGRAAALLLLGLTPYVYLLWAGGRNVPVVWGETTTLAAAWEHVTRGQYFSDDPIDAPVVRTAALIAGRFYYALRWIGASFGVGLLPLLACGMIALWRRRRNQQFTWVVLLIAGCGPLYLFVGGPKLDRQDEFVQKVFLTPLALVLAIPLAAGLGWARMALRVLARRIVTIGRSGARARPMTRWVDGCSLAAVAALPVIGGARENWMASYYYAADHGRNLLECLQPHAIIFPSGDHNTFPLIYLIHVEGIRPDVTIADKYGYIDLDLYRDMPNNPGKPRTPAQREEIERWVICHARRPIYYTVKKSTPIDEADLVPAGLLFHLKPRGQSFDPGDVWRRIGYRNLEGLYAPIDYAASNILADYHYARAVREFAAGRTEAGRCELHATLRYAWGIREIYNNVASTLADAGLLDEAIGYYEEAARDDWRYSAARWNLAHVFQSTDRYGWAAKVFEDLARATPGDFRPFGELGFVHARHLHDPEAARNWWYESLRINPRQPEIINALAELDHPTAPPAATTRPAASQPAAPSPAAETNGHSTTQPAPSLTIEPRSLDYGTLVAGMPVETTLQVRNTGTVKATVQVQASCDCVAPAVKQLTLDPGRSAALPVVLHTDRRRGALRESLSLANRDGAPLGRVEVQAHVLPPLTVEPAALTLARQIQPRAPPIELLVTHAAGQRFALTAVECDLTGIDCQWDPTRRQASHRVQFVVTRPLPERQRGTLRLRTDPDFGPPLEVPIHLVDPPRLVAEPATLLLGRVASGPPVRRMVTLRPVDPKDDLTPRLLHRPGEPWLRAQVERDSAGGAEWTLTVEVDPANAPTGPFEAQVEVVPAADAAPVVVRLYGHVAP